MRTNTDHGMTRAAHVSVLSHCLSLHLSLCPVYAFLIAIPCCDHQYAAQRHSAAQSHSTALLLRSSSERRPHRLAHFAHTERPLLRAVVCHHDPVQVPLRCEPARCRRHNRCECLLYLLLCRRGACRFRASRQPTGLRARSASTRVSPHPYRSNRTMMAATTVTPIDDAGSAIMRVSGVRCRRHAPRADVGSGPASWPPSWPPNHPTSSRQR